MSKTIQARNRPAEAVAQLLDNLGCSQPAEQILELVSAANRFSKMALVDALQKIPDGESEQKESVNDEPTLAPLVDAFEAAILFSGIVGTQKSVSGLNALLTQLKRFRSMSFESLFMLLRRQARSDTKSQDRESSRDDISAVENYIAALNASIGQPAIFEPLFEKLKSDAAIKQPEMVEIASAVAFKMAKGTSKTKALTRIWEQHETSEATGAKIRASDGRSAA